MTGERGVSLVEATIVVVAVAILSGIAAPAASRTLDRARLTRAAAEVDAIKAAMHNWATDLAAYQGFRVNGASSANTPIQMAVGDGDIPRELGAGGDARWTHPVSSPTPPPGFLIVDFLENHLVLNNPFGGAAADAYLLAGANTWRGAYMNAPVDPDPWGNRYSVNVEFLQAPANTRNDTLVLSAGPDEQIDTSFQADGIVPGDDDIIAVVNRDQNTKVPAGY